MPEVITKKSKERSVAYPGIALKEAIELAVTVFEKLGRGPYSRHEVAKALGHPNMTGPAARKVAALAHFGLLERVGSSYNQTELAQDILRPSSDDEKAAAVIRAARKPRLFDKLLQRYRGQALPTMLPNILRKDGIKGDAAAQHVARIFDETMRYASILVNGIIVDSSTAESGVLDEDTNNGITRSFPPNSPRLPSKVSVPGVDDFVFEFTGGIKLFIPRTKGTSEAIADGALKSIRESLSAFAGDFIETKKEDDSRTVNVDGAPND